MKQYRSNTNYNAILEAMQEIRGNASELVESMHGDEEEMDEGHNGHMDDEEAEAIAEMMDEALHEMDMEDDEDNLNEADDDRRTRRRNRLRTALLIGAGLAAAGGAGAAYARGRGMNPASDIRRQAGYASGVRGAMQDIGTGAGAYGSDVMGAITKRLGRG